MTSTVPAIIAWPVIVCMVILLAVRYRLCNTNLYESYFNNLMAWVLVAQLLREHYVEDALSRHSIMSVTTAQQLGFAAMVFASTELIGFTMVWTGLSPAETRRRQRYYRVAALVSCVAFLAAATRARDSGQTLEVSGGWDAVLAWGFYLLMLLVMTARFVRMFASELAKTTQKRELMLAAGGLALGIVTAAGCLEALVSAVTDQLGWTHTVEFRLWFHGFEFFCIAVFVFILGAVPLVVKLLSYLGLDRVSRTWKLLQPLRLAMTAVVPESSFDLGYDERRSQIARLQLHQTVIEIRDAMLQLRPYFQEVDPQDLPRLRPRGRQREAATLALRLAYAARAKSVGAVPARAEAAPIGSSRATTLDEEARELLNVARWWPAACAAAQETRPTEVRSPA